MADMEDERVASPPACRPCRRSFLLGTVILLCGMGIGSVLTLQFVRVREASPRPDGRPRAERIVERLRKDLALTDEQAKQVRAIFDRNIPLFDAIRAKVQPELDAHIEKVHAEVAATLTPGQVTKWDAHLAMMRERWQAHGHGPGDGHNQ